MKEEFLQELRHLIDKYKITVNSSDQYDGEDKYMGTISHLVFDGTHDYTQTVDEIFKSILK